MLPIDIYDSATPEPGFEGMSAAEIAEVIDEYEAESAAYYEEQNRYWRTHAYS